MLIPADIEEQERDLPPVLPLIPSNCGSLILITVKSIDCTCGQG